MSDYGMALQMLMMFVPSVLSAVVGWLAARYKTAKATAESEDKVHKATAECCIVLMGARIDALCEEYEHAGRVTTEQTQHLVHEWELYHGCGGDGVRTARIEKLLGMKLEELV